MIRRSRTTLPRLFMCLGLAAAPCAAGVPIPGAGFPGAGLPGAPPNYGFNFATITHPGNAPVSVPDPNFGPPQQVGRVDYAYRMATTEVTNANWLEFVRAYFPLRYPGDGTGAAEDLGLAIQYTGLNQQGQPTYNMPASRANQPVLSIGWRNAARYVNWLSSGKPAPGVATLDDFATGAYDTSTFGTAPYPGIPGLNYLTDQPRRSEGALYWIPSFDEWVKAAHFDPNRYGPGQPGYWEYPITSDTAPIPGRPENGGQTNAGPFPVGQTRPTDVGSYPTVMSPWGLLDLSGGGREWLEDNGVGGYVEFPFGRRWAGSSFLDHANTSLIDVLRYSESGSITGHVQLGLRIASAVPSPSGVVVVMGIGLYPALRRRRPCAGALIVHSSPR